jgi:hypothetical protein
MKPVRGINRYKWVYLPFLYRRQVGRHYSVILPLHSNPNDYFSEKEVVDSVQFSVFSVQFSVTSAKH